VAAVEGMSAGLFPLLSEIPPFRRLVARTGLGMTINYSLPDDGARGLLELLPKIAASYRRRRAACMRAARAYDWPAVCQKYIELYKAAIGVTVRTIFDVPVQARTFAEAVELIDTRFARRDQVAIAFANAHALNVASEDPEFRAALQNSLVFNDGIGVDIASRLLYGSPFAENLNGTDFGPNYLRATRHRYRIFLLGATPGTAERAAEHLSSLCLQHLFVGCHHGHFDASQLPEIVDLIRKSKADLLLVAMGNPKQELFIRKHLDATGCVVGMGVGALFDFLAGNVLRAPTWIQRCRLEWFYRLAQEPQRLARRYLAGNPLFLMRVARQFWSGARVGYVGPELIIGRNKSVVGRRTLTDRKVAAQTAASTDARAIPALRSSHRPPVGVAGNHRRVER
jgi:alpha-1,3-mannosyltransferase